MISRRVLSRWGDSQRSQWLWPQAPGLTKRRSRLHRDPRSQPRISSQFGNAVSAISSTNLANHLNAATPRIVTITYNMKKILALVSWIWMSLAWNKPTSNSFQEARRRKKNHSRVTSGYVKSAIARMLWPMISIHASASIARPKIKISPCWSPIWLTKREIRMRQNI